LQLLLLLVLLAGLTAACRKTEAANQASDTAPPVVTATEVVATPTAATVATATIVLNDVDKAFVADAAKDLLSEVELAHVADRQATNVAVKAFAHLMVQDMERLTDELKRFASKRAVVLPSRVEVRLTELHNKLASMSGKNFDEAFLRQVIEDHFKMISKYDAEAAIVGDPDLQDWVAKTLPVLHNHIVMAKELQAKLARVNY
jgi:putative membrane protein